MSPKFVEVPMDNWSATVKERDLLRVVNAELLAALKSAVAIAEEARKEWDAAPSEMRAGKILIALGGGLRGYRSDIDAIHGAIAKAEAES